MLRKIAIALAVAGACVTTATIAAALPGRVDQGATATATAVRVTAPPAPTYKNITFPEGFTLTQMAGRVGAEFELLSASGFLAASQEEYTSLFEPPGGAASLEGLLFPDTYQVSTSLGERRLIERMITVMERVGNQEDIVTKSAALGRTPYEILIIASMIEKEAKVAEDRAKISRVIHNRLFVTQSNPDDPPFRLQIDAAVLYGRDQLGIDTNTAFSTLRQIPSDWNTYMLPALPLTPIASPGRASIAAALNPAANPSPDDPVCRDLPQPGECSYFFYVIADANGRHVFAATGEQHLANVEVARQAGLL